MVSRVRLPDLPELPEISLLDEDDIGRRIGRVAEVIGAKTGKRIGFATGGIASFVVGVVNDVLELPRELTKK